MLTASAPAGPLIMHAGDTITDHQYVTPAADGMHVTNTDLSTGHAGTIVLNSKVDGPLMLPSACRSSGTPRLGQVNDARDALVWEVGHTGEYTHPADQFCLPGSATKPACFSYDVPTWLQFPAAGLPPSAGARRGPW